MNYVIWTWFIKNTSCSIASSNVWIVLLSRCNKLMYQLSNYIHMICWWFSFQIELMSTLQLILEVRNESSIKTIASCLTYNNITWFSNMSIRYDSHLHAPNVAGVMLLVHISFVETLFNKHLFGILLRKYTMMVAGMRVGTRYTTTPTT